MNKFTFKNSGLESWVNTLSEDRISDIKEDVFTPDFTDIYGDQLVNYELKENMGISGILLPSGHFLKCGNAQHSLISSILALEEQFLSIYFSSRLHEDDQSTMSFHLHNNPGGLDSNVTRARVIISLGLKDNKEALDSTLITSSQLDFIENNFKNMNKFQREMVCLYLLRKKTEVFSKEKLMEDYYIMEGF